MTSCSLRQCIQGGLEPDMAQVHVKTTVVSHEDVKYMEVAWTPTGEAVFHDICWKAAMDSVRMDNPFVLSALEKDLLILARRTAEFFDSQDKIIFEARRIAHMIKSAKHAVAFTGAGISTAAGIGDFRGRAGRWTERDRDKITGGSSVTSHDDVMFESRRPTYTHEALTLLVERGYIKYVISQNTDGLHRLSGIPREKVSELHGNAFHERCEKCGARYERSYAVFRRATHHAGTSTFQQPRGCVHCHCDHSTGGTCERKGCEGSLVNCIVNFGDSLEKKVLSAATEQARRNDLMLCLGSSLRVAPACDLVEMGLNPVRLVICNRKHWLYYIKRKNTIYVITSIVSDLPAYTPARQPTPFDRLCYTSTSCSFNSSSTAQIAQRISNQQHQSSIENQNSVPPRAADVPMSLRPINDEVLKLSSDVVACVSERMSHEQAFCAVGSRVFGDCDVLMHEVMAALFSVDELREWERGGEKRRAEFSRLRGGATGTAVHRLGEKN